MPLKPAPLILVSAGEPSSDLHAASVLEALRRKHDFDVVGIGGSGLRAIGAKLLDTSGISGKMGFSEPLSTIAGHIRLLIKIRHMASRHSPCLALLVDYGGFNIPLLCTLKKLGIPAVYYMCPKVWAWGRFRGRIIADRADEILSVFPFEHRVYCKYNAKSRYIGHPLADIIHCSGAAQNTSKKILMLMPGSRREEIRHLLPAMAQAAGTWLADKPDWKAVLPVAPGISTESVKRFMPHDSPIHIISPANRFSWLKTASLAIVSSGTATMECMLTDTPMVVIYRVSRISAAIARLVTTLDNFSLPNIIAGRRIVPELIQSQVSPERIIKSLDWLERMSATIIREFDRHSFASGAIDQAVAVLEKYLHIDTPGRRGRVKA